MAVSAKRNNREVLTLLDVVRIRWPCQIAQAARQHLDPLEVLALGVGHGAGVLASHALAFFMLM
jgi:hypothetical protein